MMQRKYERLTRELEALKKSADYLIASAEVAGAEAAEALAAVQEQIVSMASRRAIAFFGIRKSDVLLAEDRPAFKTLTELRALMVATDSHKKWIEWEGMLWENHGLQISTQARACDLEEVDR